MKNEYELIDSGNGKKLERFGKYILIRPSAQAVWKPQKGKDVWRSHHTSFDRDHGNRWHNRSAIPEEWTISIDGLKFRLSGTDFGHIGIFPEQRPLWSWLSALFNTAKKTRGRRISILNLFAYSGGVTLAAAKTGSAVCHLDASKGMVDWARENAKLNGLSNAPIRWIVDDVHKFLNRELRRKKTYDAIVLDPPSFGRGRGGEVYRIDKDLLNTLVASRSLLSDDPLCILLSSHTPGYTPLVLHNLLSQAFTALPGCLEFGEMLLTGPNVFPLPSGAYARWTAAHYSG